MPAEALIVMLTAWGLAALTVLGTQLACLRLGRNFPQQKRTVGLAAAIALGWVLSTGLIAASGRLSNFEKMPPPFLVLLGICAVFTVCVAFSTYGTLWMRGLSYSQLIGFQVFRVAAEAMLYYAYLHGQAPVQMTFEGWNYDILPGLTALPVAWWVSRHPSRTVVYLWNVAGLLLLVTIVGIAIASAPTPLRVFMNEPANVFVAKFPYVWLPAVLVQYALLGHLLSFRKLWDTRH
jgi:hypothetical protein